MNEAVNFDADVDCGMPDAELLQDDDGHKADYARQVTAAMNSIKQMIQEHRGDDVANALSFGQSIWQPRAYGVQYHVPPAIAKLINDPQTELEKTDEQFHFVFGKRAVLVYVEGGSTRRTTIGRFV